MSDENIAFPGFSSGKPVTSKFEKFWYCLERKNGSLVFSVKQFSRYRKGNCNPNVHDLFFPDESFLIFHQKRFVRERGCAGSKSIIHHPRGKWVMEHRGVSDPRLYAAIVAWQYSSTHRTLCNKGLIDAKQFPLWSAFLKLLTQRRPASVSSPSSFSSGKMSKI